MATEFTNRTIAVLKKVPRGKVVTYGLWRRWPAIPEAPGRLSAL